MKSAYFRLLTLLLVASHVDCKLESTNYVQPSLFSKFPPFIHFKSIFQRKFVIPAEIQNHLLWLEGIGYRKQLQDKTLLVSGHKLISQKELRINTNSGQSTTLGWLKHPGTKNLRNHPVQSFQKVNSFPGMTELSYKDRMYIHSKDFLKRHPEIQMPSTIPTFVLPREMELFKRAWHGTENKIWISKLPKESLHRGLKIRTSWIDFQDDEHRIVQKYIHNPALYKNRKIEFQFPFFVTSVHPLRIYSHPFHCKVLVAQSNSSTVVEDLENHCVHVHTHNDGVGEACFTKVLHSPNGESENIDELMTEVNERFDLGNLLEQMGKAILLNLLSVEKVLTNAFYKKAKNRYNFFHILAADFVLDDTRKLWHMEINSAPLRTSVSDWEKKRHQDYYSEILNTAGYHFPPNIDQNGRDLIRQALVAQFQNDSIRSLPESLVFDEKFYVLKLNADEQAKQNIFANISERSLYLNSILQNLSKDDLRILMVAEDELNNLRTAKRIFPTAGTYKYIPFVESSNYYYKLVDAWETKYGENRKEGHALLEKLWNAESQSSSGSTYEYKA